MDRREAHRRMTSDLADIVRDALRTANEDVYGDEGNADAFVALDELQARAEEGDPD